MGYVISLGAGLAVGVAFLIWALVERKKRYTAEQSYQASKTTCAGLRRDIVKLSTDIHKACDEKQRIESQVSILHGIVEQLREKLMQCRDPETVRAWLDDELSKQV